MVKCPYCQSKVTPHGKERRKVTIKTMWRCTGCKRFFHVIEAIEPGGQNHDSRLHQA